MVQGGFFCNPFTAHFDLLTISDSIPSASIPQSEAPHTHVAVAVRDMVAFVLQAGTRGHKRVQQARLEDYQSELD